MTHWFDQFRGVYRQWWDSASVEFESDELEEFELFRNADSLTPLSEITIGELQSDFSKFPPQLHELLAGYGVGEFHFPPCDDEDEPDIYRFFSRQEVLPRIASISAHAQGELDNASHAKSCEVHSNQEECIALLTRVRDRPQQLYPLFGPEDVYDFVYVRLEQEEKSGQKGLCVGRWYHDYPVCELLDGSGVSDDLRAYGESFLKMATSRDGRCL